MTIRQPRHAGLVPASTEPHALEFEARWTPAQGRGDGVLLAVEERLLEVSLEGSVERYD